MAVKYSSHTTASHTATRSDGPDRGRGALRADVSVVTLTQKKKACFFCFTIGGHNVTCVMKSSAWLLYCDVK